MVGLLDRIVVVIVNWERLEDTIECVRSVLASDLKPEQVLLVDNGSRDDSVTRVKDACPGISLLSLEENRGFAGGYNAGIECALLSGAERILLLNNDTVVDPQAIPLLAETSWDAAIPKILYYEQPERIWAAGAAWRSFPPSVVMTGYNKLDGPAYNTPRKLDYATGCAIMAKRRVLECVGGFNPEFENYMEDYDFFHRLRGGGFRVGYVPEARIFHKVSQTLGPTSAQRWFYLGRNTVLFYRIENRFPAWMLWSYLGWYGMREFFKGQSKFLPDFWRGVQAGLAWLKDKAKDQHGAHSL